MDEIIYTNKFINAIKNGVPNAKINSNQFVNCPNSVSNSNSDSKDSFLKVIISKNLLGLIGSTLYQIVQNSDNLKLKRFLNFFVYLAYNWEVTDGSFNKKILSECPQLNPKKWRDGMLSGKQPLFMFSAITSMYGDIVLGLISYLLQKSSSKDSFIFGQEQEAKIQELSERAGNGIYRDSDNFNPREAFLDGSYPLSLLPQMIWHSFTLDIIRYDRSNRDTIYRDLEELGAQYMNPQNVREYQKRMRLIIALALRELPDKPFQITVNAIESFLNKIDLTSPDDILEKLISLVKEFIPSVEKNNPSKKNGVMDKNIMVRAIRLMENVIESVGNNFNRIGSNELFMEIRRFYSS